MDKNIMSIIYFSLNKNQNDYSDKFINMIVEIDNITNKVYITFNPRNNNLDILFYSVNLNLKPLTVEDTFSKIKGEVKKLEVVVKKIDKEIRYLLIGITNDVNEIPYYIISEFDNMDTAFSIKQKLESKM